MESRQQPITMKRAAFISLITTFLCVVSDAQGQKIDCPTLSVIGPVGVTSPGDVMTFTVEANESLPSGAIYAWTVSAGTIESGQGTNTIHVRVPFDRSADAVIANVTLRGINRCLVAASATAAADTSIGPEPYDTYGKLSPLDESVRFRNAANTLTKFATDSKLYIVKWFPRYGKRERDIIQSLTLYLTKNLHISRDRFEFIIGRRPEVHTMFVIGPPGMTLTP